MAFAIGLILTAWALCQESQPAGRGADNPAAAPGEIEKLIKDLGDDRWQVRDTASRRLGEIGRPTVHALQQAVMSPDLEVKFRAKSLLNSINRLEPDEFAGRRAEIQKAFRDANYPAAIRTARRVVSYENAETLDWLWFGHACQLGGQWSDAVRAYRKVVECIDEDIREGVRDAPANAVPARIGPPGVGGGPIVVIGPVAPPGPIPLSPREIKELINQRSGLMLWIARMQASELKDPAAAAKTLAEALAYLEASKTEIDYLWLEIVKARPLLLHQAGDVAGAMVAWKQSVATRSNSRHDFPDSRRVDVELIYKALCTLPARQPRPDVPWILFFDEDKPTWKIDLDDANTLTRSYQTGTYNYFALAPPRGKEFASIEFACDIEQSSVRLGGQFRCFLYANEQTDTWTTLGEIGWPGKEPGRAVVAKSFNIPAGAGLVHFRVCNIKELTVHSVSAKATLRPATKDPAPILSDASIQAEFHPANCHATWGTLVLQDGRAYHGLRPASNALKVMVPGRKDPVEIPLTVQAGRRYGAFFNVDSPFQCRQLDLVLSDSGATSRLSIQRLDPHGYIAIWCGSGHRLMAARSTDLVTWTTPQPLPFNSVFDNIEPATYRAPDGTIYLAYFSNRLSPHVTNTSGYHLWLTSTRDGRKWAPLRRVEKGPMEGQPPTAPCMLTGPDGKQWLFWRDMAGSGKTLDEIAELTQIQVANRTVNGITVNLWNVNVVLDDQKRFHMVCDDFGDAICHLSSTDGWSWTQPQRLVVKTKDPGPDVHDAQLILSGDKAALIYSGSLVAPVSFEAGKVSVGEAVKFTGVYSYLGGATAFRRGEEVFFVAGSETTCLLRANLKDLLVPSTNK
jgi:tetratricopeptide (TPR) repeat protein